MDEKEFLKAVRKIVEDKWCQGNYWAWKEGVPATQKTVTRCCLVGAVFLVEGSENSLRRAALDRMTNLAGSSLILYNDKTERTKEDVLALIDQAIGEVS